MTVEQENFGTTYKDPAMVTVQFDRINVGGLKGHVLFGSSVGCNQIISLKISQAEVSRNLSEDWVHGEGPIIEVWLTPSQFAELITSMNYGSGAPGTLRWLRGEGSFDLPELPSKSEQFKEEIDEDIKKFRYNIIRASKKAKDMLDDPKPPTKAVRQELKSMIDSIEAFASSQLSFVMDQFNQQMARTVSECKAEVDAFVTHVVQKTGLDTLKDSVPQISYTKQEQVGGAKSE
jgi:archaellum component FlaC